jgi:hypothetical protein
MDQTNIVIQSVTARKIPLIEIQTNEGNIYQSDLSEFKTIKCFPKSQKEWENVSVTAHGFNLTWGTRFEIHVHQAIDAATKVKPIKKQA